MANREKDTKTGGKALDLLFEGQVLHLLALALLLWGATWLADDMALSGSWLGVSTRVWFVLAIAVPVVHQVYVWLAWRLELHYGQLTRWFGPKGFTLYAAGFTVFFVLRLLTIIALAVSNRFTVSLPAGPAYGAAVVCFALAVYLMVSVKRFFGFQRAYGIDHFDPAYRSKEFVRQGIFRWTPNAMYVFGFLILWVPGLLLFSKGALLAALFNHLYIWVHYYCTELPDIRRIYAWSR